MLTKELVKTYLLENFIMSLSVIRPDGEPYSMAMLYQMGEDFNFYFLTREDSNKAKYLESNSHVSMVIGFEKPMSVQVEGEANIVTDEGKRNFILQAFTDTTLQKKDFWPPILYFGESRYLIYQVTPEWIRALDLTEKNIAYNGDPFLEIKPGK